MHAQGATAGQERVLRQRRRRANSEENVAGWVRVRPLNAREAAQKHAAARPQPERDERGPAAGDEERENARGAAALERGRDRVGVCRVGPMLRGRHTVAGGAVGHSRGFCRSRCVRGGEGVAAAPSAARALGVPEPRFDPRGAHRRLGRRACALST
jgi:hypothetical protein